MSKQTNEELAKVWGFLEEISNRMDAIEEHLNLGPYDELPEEEKPCHSEWQPIETAPKDGTYILLSAGKARDATGTSIVLGRWYTTSNNYMMGYWSPAFGTAQYMYPKYWMPLPKVPCEENPCPEDRPWKEAFEFIVDQFSILVACQGSQSNVTDRSKVIFDEAYKLLKICNLCTHCHAANYLDNPCVGDPGTYRCCPKCGHMPDSKCSDCDGYYVYTKMRHGAYGICPKCKHSIPILR